MKIKIKITSLGSSGEGIGSKEGLKVFVEGALPGEEVEVTLSKVKKNYALGQLETIVSVSEQRQSPPCPLFGQCGGCQLMHLSYEGQLDAKRQKVVDALERIGGFKGISVDLCLPSPLKLHYRNKIQLPVIWDLNEKKIGLFRKNSHEIIPVDRCLIQDQVGEDIFIRLKPLLNVSTIRYLLIRTANATKEALILLVTTGKETSSLKELAQKIVDTIPEVKGVIENINERDDNVILGPYNRLLAGQLSIEEELDGKKFRISASSFFQVNPLQAKNLFNIAMQWAELKPFYRVLDAFCGVGTLALFAANQVKEVIGIECVAQAIENAKENAQLNGIKNCVFYCGKAEILMKRLPPADVVFLNPPRKGCELELLKQLHHQKVRTLIYISCDPATLARDLKILVSLGYHIDRVLPLDMFPQTMHVETMVRLRL